jgi:phosphatidylethanolamine/phosphatidyl-N-methylethanolamine N-methyltransferase
MSGDLGVFFGQLFRKPGQVVALAPSSRALAAEMAATLDPGGGPVIELGAGTGRITQAIIDRGIAPDQIHAIEMNPVFCDDLRAGFAGLNVHQCSATEVGALDITGAQAVVSGLPLLSMPLPVQDAILRGSFAQIGPLGSYIQFTYGPKPPVKQQLREALGLTWTTSTKIWGNLPPARVYRFAMPVQGGAALS